MSVSIVLPVASPRLQGLMLLASVPSVLLEEVIQPLELLCHHRVRIVRQGSTALGRILLVSIVVLASSATLRPRTTTLRVSVPLVRLRAAK